MTKEPSERFDVLVIGGGPAGMAAAACATENRRRVGIIDDNPDLGGQIWRGASANPGSLRRTGLQGSGMPVCACDVACAFCINLNQVCCWLKAREVRAS